MQDLSRALQFLLCSIGNFFLFLLRTISLSVRLIRNMMAGHYLIHIITGFIIGLIISVTSTVTGFNFNYSYFLHIFTFRTCVAFLQAFIFTILTCNLFKWKQLIQFY